MKLITFQDFSFDKWYKEWYYNYVDDITISFHTHESIILGDYNSSSSPIFCYVYSIGFFTKIEEDVRRGSELFHITPEKLFIQSNCDFQFSMILPEVAKLIIISGSIDSNVIDLNTIDIMLLVGLANEYFSKVIDGWLDNSLPIPMIDIGD